MARVTRKSRASLDDATSYLRDPGARVETALTPAHASCGWRRARRSRRGSSLSGRLPETAPIRAPPACVFADWRRACVGFGAAWPERRLTKGVWRLSVRACHARAQALGVKIRRPSVKRDHCARLICRLWRLARNPFVTRRRKLRRRRHGYCLGTSPRLNSPLTKSRRT